MVQDKEIDQYGINPLVAEIFDTVDSSNSVNVTVDASIAGNPQMVSYRQFGTNAYWRHILIANGLYHPSEMIAGMVVRVPIQRPTQTKKSVIRTTI